MRIVTYIGPGSPISSIRKVGEAVILQTDEGDLMVEVTKGRGSHGSRVYYGCTLYHGRFGAGLEVEIREDSMEITIHD